MGIFTAGREALSNAFEVNAETLQYSHSGTIKTVLCKIGKTVFRTDDFASAVSIHTEAKDFIVRNEDLNLVPEKGDYIRYASHNYVVYAPNGETCFRAHTTDASQIRIHAILDDSVTFPEEE